MTASNTTALAFAGAAAIGYGVGSVAQAVGARRTADTLRALGNPVYLAGIGCDLLAWLASLVALHTLAVYQVQALLAGSLAVTVVTARLVLATPVRRRDLLAIVATILALAAVARSAGPPDPVRASTTLDVALAAAAVLLPVAGWRTAHSGSAITSAALAGAGFGGAALCARTLPLPDHLLRHPDAAVAQLATAPTTWALIVFGLTGTLLYARALRHGQVGPITAVLWVVEVLGPSIIGVAVLGDTVRAGWAPWAAVAVLAILAATAVLATAPAQGERPGAEAAADPASPSAFDPAVACFDPPECAPSRRDHGRGSVCGVDGPR